MYLTDQEVCRINMIWMKAVRVFTADAFGQGKLHAERNVK